MTASPRTVPELAGADVLLSAWHDNDAGAVVEIADDPASRAWLPSMRELRTLADARDWMGSRVADPDRVEWAIRDPTTRQVLGRVNLHRFTAHPPAAEVGYAVQPRHRRRGVARAAIETTVRYAVAELGLVRVTLVHATGNLASCTVATGCGFAYEGTERAALDHGDGVLHDVHRHARLATDPPGPAVPAPAPLEPVELATGDLTLRPWQLSDAEVVLAALSDPLAAKWNPRLPLRDLDQARTWLDGRAARWREGSAATWAVVEDDRVVGSVALRELNRSDAYAVTSYWTVPAARGRGVAVHALGRATEYAFADLGMHRVQLAHVVENTASCRVAEKAGFLLEGTLRASNRLSAGFSDEHLHARLATDHPPVTGPG